MSEHNYDVIIIGGGPAELFEGIACARNELRTLVNSGNLVKAMFDYSQASAQIYRRYQIMTSLVLLLRLWPKLTDGVIQVLHSFPALFQKLLSVNMR